MGARKNPFARLLREAYRRSLWQVLALYAAASWVIFEIVQTLTEGLGLPDWFPSFAFVLLLLGLPAVLTVAFVQKSGRGQDRRAAEAELDRIFSDKEAEGGAASSPLRSRFPGSTLYVAGAAAVALFALVATGWILLGPGMAGVGAADEGDARLRSIAVLPLANFGDDGPHAYFAGGFHDELLTQLAKVEQLTVMGRTSVLPYAESSKPLAQIAEELGVGSVVEGSVQVLGNRLRVNVQLLEAESGRHLWAERYDRTLDDAFAVQSEIARQVVAAVGAELTGATARAFDQAPTSDSEAYRLFLQGEDYRRRPGYVWTNLRIASGLYEQAIDRDSTFALAFASLSFVHGAMYWTNWDPEHRARMHAAAETAVELAPNLPQARWARGLAYYRGERDYVRALEEFEAAARELPGSSELQARIAYVHRRLGNWDEALEALGRAATLDPRDANLYYERGQTLQALHRYEEAIEAYDRAVQLAPDLWQPRLLRAETYLHWRGELDSLRALVPFERRLFQARQLLWEQKPDSLLALLGELGDVVFATQHHFVPGALYAAWGHDLSGDGPAARREYSRALMQLDSALSGSPDDWRIHASRGLALAGLGRTAEATGEAEWLSASPDREDALDRLRVDGARALILAQNGLVEETMAMLDPLLMGPSFTSVAVVRLDPRYDPVRQRDEFQALLERHER